MPEPALIADARLMVGHVLDLLRGLPAESVHCCITSPPYWGLRAYGTEPQVWGDGWCGELGSEPTPDLYVAHLVEVFREVRRVLRPDASLWLNLGDTFASGKGTCRNPGGGPKSYIQEKARFPLDRGNKSTLARAGLKPKDLVGIPWRVAFALQVDGWYLRSCIPWVKRNAMPSSVRDRPPSAVEYVFLLTKAARCYYDGEAVKLPGAGVRGGGYFGKQSADATGTGAQQRTYDRPDYKARARRNSDWFFESWQGLYTDDEGEPLALIVNPASFKGAHFATFPPKLVEPMVKAGTGEKGCCPECGKPWVRVVQGSTAYASGSGRSGRLPKGKGRPSGDGQIRAGHDIRMGNTPVTHTLGWRPTCNCGGEAVPCTVLDPFVGAGTVCLVANQLGRRSIGIELKPEYARMAEHRLRRALNPATYVPGEGGDDLPLLAGMEKKETGS